MIASWIAETVRGFGRQLGLSSFALNDRGAAGVRFENGRALYLEYGEAGLMISVGVPAEASADTMRKLLVCAHPSARTGGLRLRAFWLERAHEARFAARLGDRDLTTTGLEQTFHALWQMADSFGRAVA